MSYKIILPSKPNIILEEGNKGVYEIEGLYGGYGHTLGNSLRRIMLSSLPGAAVTTVKISGVNHEFSTIPGVKEDVIAILLNLKQIRFKFSGEGPYKATLSSKSTKDKKELLAENFEIPSQIEILNTDKHIATLADKNTNLEIEITVEKGLGYVPKEILKKEKVETGTLMIDAVFTPIRRVNYEVENMRVGDRTDFNRLRFLIETDGSITPKKALENSINTLIRQLSAVLGFKEEETEKIKQEVSLEQKESEKKKQKKAETAKETAKEKEEKVIETEESKEDFLKTRIEDLNFSNRTLNALSKASIRTVGGLARKKEEDLLEVDGLGDKSINEIRRALGNFGLILK